MLYLEDTTGKDRVLRYRIVFKSDNKTYILEKDNGWSYTNMFLIMEEIKKYKEISPFLIDGFFEINNLKKLAENENNDNWTFLT